MTENSVSLIETSLIWSGIFERKLIFFPLMLLSQPFWGQDGLVMTHKTSTASAAHF